MMSSSRMERRIRVAAAFAMAGLMVELMTLRGSHPTAFLVFALAGAPLVGASILIFLYSLVSVAE